jgi:hypothetical protein
MISLTDAEKIHYGRLSYNEAVTRPVGTPKPTSIPIPLTDDTIVLAVQQVQEYFKKKEEAKEYTKSQEEERERQKKQREEQERLDEISRSCIIII